MNTTELDTLDVADLKAVITNMNERLMFVEEFLFDTLPRVFPHALNVPESIGLKEGGGTVNTNELRDAARREENHSLLERIAEVWDMFPNEGFGQLVINLSSLSAKNLQRIYDWEHSHWLAELDKLKAEGVLMALKAEARETTAPAELQTAFGGLL